MDSDQTPINAAPARQRKLPTAAEDLALAFEEKVVWPVEAGTKSFFEVARWPFERVWWALQRALIWPLQDRFGELGGPARALTVAAGATVIAVGVLALVIATSGGSGGTTASPVGAATTVPTVKVTIPPPVEKKAEPTLHGAAPVFKPAKTSDSSSSVDPAKPIESAPAEPATATGSSAATAKISSDPAAATASAARASTVPGPPAGKEAIAVAREFSDAFVVYETGGEEAKVSKAFDATATPELAKALLKRPPRLPANVKVPRAKVLNIVAGPSQGKVYTLSVSLLRVGVTSELRLEMEDLKGEGWRVTNVLG